MRHKSLPVNLEQPPIPPAFLVQHQRLGVQPRQHHDDSYLGSIIPKEKLLKAMAPCKFFAHGSCFYGASCRNSHDVPAQAASASSPSVHLNSTTQEGIQRTPPELTIPKTVSCWFFTQGKCKYGVSCKNIHDPPDDVEHISLSQKSAPSAAFSADTVSRNDAESKVTTSPENHLKPEAASFTPKFEAPSIPQQDRPKFPIPCRFFARGICSRGESCAFLHIGLPKGEYAQSLDEKMPEQQVRASENLYPMHNLLITTGYCP